MRASALRDRGPRAGEQFDECAWKIDGRQRTRLGLTILKNFTTSGDGTWTGQVYDRENGKTYRCRMRQLSADELEIHPYIGIPLFGRTQIWHRAPAATETSARTR